MKKLHFTKETKITIFVMMTLAIFAIFCLFLYLNQTHDYLRFSDGAKFADIARNIVEGRGFTKNFNFFSNRAVTWPKSQPFEAASIPSLFPYSVSIMFRIFGVSDAGVMLTSALYFIGSVYLSFLLGNRLFGKVTGILSALAVGSNINLLDYATSGASETALIFLILLGFYLVNIKSKLGQFLMLGVMILLYFTRPQAIIYIIGLIFLWFLIRNSYRKSIIIIVTFVLLSVLVDRLVIYPLSIYYNIQPVYERGIQAIGAHLVNTSPSEALRGGGEFASGVFIVLRKFFYNSFNFFQRIPDIMSPYLFFAFTVGLFVKNTNSNVQKTKLAVLLVTVITFVVAALTIPFFRYLHPIVPLVYIFGTGSLETIINKAKLPKITTHVLILFLIIIPSILTLLVNNRFNKNSYNTDKPPAYVVLSTALRDNSSNRDVIVTNLDTWGSWYGMRKTIWMPLEPEQLVPPKNAPTFTMIYITNYLINDENYYLGNNWVRLLENPNQAREITYLEGFDNFTVFEYPADEVYENVPIRGVLLWKGNGSI